MLGGKEYMNKEAENNVTEVIDKRGDVIENDLVVNLHKPYKFEGSTYEKINLTGLEDLTTEDMIATNKILNRSGNTSLLPENDIEYACVIAARATKLPIEFFRNLHPKDAIKVKTKVSNFLFG